MWKWTKAKNIRAIILDTDSLSTDYIEFEYEKIIAEIKVYKASVFSTKQDFLYFDKNLLLQDVLSDANCESYSVIAISSSYYFLKDMISNHIGTIFVGAFSQDKLYQVPDFTCRNLKSLEKILNGSNYGYGAEVYCSNVHNVTTAILRCRKNIEINSQEIKSMNLFIGGRYYKMGNTYLLDDPLSKTIQMFKHRYMKPVDDFFDRSLSQICKYMHIDVITYVPLKQNGQRDFDRFKSLQLPKLKEKGFSLSTIVRCKKNFELKKLTAEARRTIVKGKFEVIEDVENKDIIIIDDVYTTGSTVSEIAKILYEHKAKSVSVLVLAVNQIIESSYLTYKQIECPICQSNMVLKVNGNDNILFFGCENHKSHEYKKYSIDVTNGLEQIKTVNKLEISDIGDLNDQY